VSGYVADRAVADKFFEELAGLYIFEYIIDVS